MFLTRKEALKLHRQMWGDMQIALSEKDDCERRCTFKELWIKEHVAGKVMHDCFLCEYAWQKSCEVDPTPDGDFHPTCCQFCPIDWRDRIYYSNGYACERGSVTWGKSPISKILALPERRTDERSD